MTGLIRVSRAAIYEKIFNVTEADLREKLTGKELEEGLALLPTEEEKEWMRIHQSKAPDLARLRHKNDVCLEAEITILEENKVGYKYNGKEFVIDAPLNSYRVSVELEKSKHDAFSEMCFQGCVTVDGVKLDAKKSKLSVDELNLAVKIADHFFFQTSF